MKSSFPKGFYSDHEKYFHAILILGKGKNEEEEKFLLNEVERLSALYEKHGLSYIIIGNGSDTIEYTHLFRYLHNKLTENTRIDIIAHGDLIEKDVNGEKILEHKSLIQKTDSYADNIMQLNFENSTYKLIKYLKVIFDSRESNEDSVMTVNATSCHIGAVINSITPKDTGIRFILNGGIKYPVFMYDTFRILHNEILLHANGETPQTQFLHKMSISTETAYYVEPKDGEIFSFKYNAPQITSSINNCFIKKHIESYKKQFLDFCNENFGSLDIGYSSNLTECILQNYKDRAALMEDRRIKYGSNNGEKYVSSYLDSNLSPKIKKDLIKSIAERDRAQNPPQVSSVNGILNTGRKQKRENRELLMPENFPPNKLYRTSENFNGKKYWVELRIKKSDDIQIDAL